MNRRGFITRLTSIIAAPAIVRIELIMPVKAVESILPYEVKLINHLPDGLFGYKVTWLNWEELVLSTIPVHWHEVYLK